MTESFAKIIAVDFDGTLCENKWPEIGEKNQEVIDYILAEQSDGAKLILWTNRCGEELDKAVAWCKDRGIEFDAVNENLQSTIDFFGGDPRKIYANEYIDDKASTKFMLPYKFEEKTEMETWAEREIELASKRDQDYGRACYRGALQAFKTLIKQNHSGYSIWITKTILNRLIDGKPLVSIDDTEDVWNYIHEEEAENVKVYQCNRMSSLFKRVYSDGTIKYSDIDSCYGVYEDDPDGTGSIFGSGLIRKIYDEMWPITMPYWPGKATKFLVREFLFDHENGDFDTVAIIKAIRPDGAEFVINRYFKESKSDWNWTEIDEAEYINRTTKKPAN